jgi:TatD DNase family protein
MSPGFPREFVDTHAHLQGPEFSDDASAVIQRAREAGVTAIVVPAVDLASAQAGLALAARHDGVYSTAGYHPHEASRLDTAEIDAIKALVTEPEVVAIGEIGLDFFRMHSSEREQRVALDSMLDVAQRVSLPVVIHCRDAWEAMAEHVVPWARRVASAFGGRPLGVMHYFTGTLEEARRYVDLGFLISVHTSVTHPKASSLRDVVAQLPLETLVIETDSPYGAPQSVRGKRNEPAYVVEAAKQIAELHGVVLEDVAKLTTANARRLFRLPVPAAAAGGHE